MSSVSMRKYLFLLMSIVTIVLGGSMLFVQFKPYLHAESPDKRETAPQASSGDKSELCDLDVTKKCMDGDVKVTVRQTGDAPTGDCDTDITLKEKGGPVIKKEEPTLTAKVPDDRDKTLIAENCCGKEKIKIKKDECDGDDDDEKKKDCCEMELTADPKPVCVGGATTVTANLEFSDNEQCSIDETGTVCQVEFEARGVSVNGNSTKTKTLQGNSVSVEYTPSELGTMIVTATPTGGKCSDCVEKEISILTKECDKCETTINVPERVCLKPEGSTEEGYRVTENFTIEGETSRQSCYLQFETKYWTSNKKKQSFKKKINFKIEDVFDPTIGPFDRIKIWLNVSDCSCPSKSSIITVYESNPDYKRIQNKSVKCDSNKHFPGAITYKVRRTRCPNSDVSLFSVEWVDEGEPEAMVREQLRNVANFNPFGITVEVETEAHIVPETLNSIKEECPCSGKQEKQFTEMKATSDVNIDFPQGEGPIEELINKADELSGEICTKHITERGFCCES